MQKKPDFTGFASAQAKAERGERKDQLPTLTVGLHMALLWLLETALQLSQKNEGEQMQRLRRELKAAHTFLVNHKVPLGQPLWLELEGQCYSLKLSQTGFSLSRPIG